MYKKYNNKYREYRKQYHIEDLLLDIIKIIYKILKITIIYIYKKTKQYNQYLKHKKTQI